jgi:hypothetical protein
MVEIKESLVYNLWTVHKLGYPIIITVNNWLNKNDNAVMGKGVALKAKNTFPNLSKMLGQFIQNYGNRTHYWKEFNIFTFPTKDKWWEKSILSLIIKSGEELLNLVNEMRINEIYLPKVGCGNGGLKWEDVKPHLKFLDDRFIVII